MDSSTTKYESREVIQKIVILPSTIQNAGCGAFANQDIRRFGLINIYHGKYVPLTFLNKNCKRIDTCMDPVKQRDRIVCLNSTEEQNTNTMTQNNSCEDDLLESDVQSDSDDEDESKLREIISNIFEKITDQGYIVGDDSCQMTFINDHKNPEMWNVFMFPLPPYPSHLLGVFALRDIQRGEELFMSYGSDFWRKSEINIRDSKTS